VFGCAVSTLKRDRDIGKLAANIDQRPAAMLQLVKGCHGSVDHTPVVGLKKLTLIFQRYLLELPEDGDASIVHPGLESAECQHGCLHDFLMILRDAHVGHN